MSDQTAKIQQREILLTARPKGVPQFSDFECVTKEIEGPRQGEILVRNRWLSVDPYMRGRMRDAESYAQPFELNAPMEGGCIGEVVQSKNDSFVVGDFVLGNLGWREHWVSDGSEVTKIDIGSVPVQSYLSVLGMTGLTAYVGLLKIGNLKENEVVFVSAASGAVGSIVCQIAKAKKCYVVGSAGSSDKIKWLKEKAGVDAAFNYKQISDVPAKVKELCPDGIDVYFDNVGGDHLEAAIGSLNNFGRIVCCGMISAYNDTEARPGPSNLVQIIGKRIRMEGFIVSDHHQVRGEFLKDMTRWIESGEIVWEETVTEGLENAPQAFIDLFHGDKMGKALVSIKDA